MTTKRLVARWPFSRQAVAVSAIKDEKAGVGGVWGGSMDR